MWSIGDKRRGGSMVPWAMAVAVVIAGMCALDVQAGDTGKAGKAGK